MAASKVRTEIEAVPVVAWTCAAEEGDLDFLQSMHAIHRPLEKELVRLLYIHASRGGHLHAIEWIHRSLSGSLWEWKQLMLSAVAAGHIHVLDWSLGESRNLIPSIFTAIIPVMADDLPTLDWFLLHRLRGVEFLHEIMFLHKVALVWGHVSVADRLEVAHHRNVNTARQLTGSPAGRELEEWSSIQWGRLFATELKSLKVTMLAEMPAAHLQQTQYVDWPKYARWAHTTLRPSKSLEDDGRAGSAE